ncbi:MAG TPA: CDP-glucose 4,6-dehydratase [Burkholderiales bacterium]|nr:CDP-glucose 4,6-dehydratase [Burkholderiales bacterium]
MSRDVRGRRILVTGHTGFKGAWLCEWLVGNGADVFGIALPPEPGSLFPRLRLDERLDHVICDIRDGDGLKAAVRRADPQIVFHLAAQALVRRSYREPITTWQTNVVGTLNVLEAARALERPVTVVVVTTDKVYRNREWEFAYRETDELGGHDPYSASKAACEIGVASWRASFGASSSVAVATARAGNVLGAGDYSEDRIVPDCYRAWSRGDAVELRNPDSTRPWQHVLEPLAGYLALAARLDSGDRSIDACNFGPGTSGDRTVRELVETMAGLGRGRRWTSTPAPGVHEARALSLSIDRARHKLGWTPRLTFGDTVEWTDAGYTISDSALPGLIARQIADYEAG